MYRLPGGKSHWTGNRSARGWAGWKMLTPEEVSTGQDGQSYCGRQPSKAGFLGRTPGIASVGVTFALGRPWATCPIIGPTGNSPLPYLYLTYRDEPELTYPLRRHGHQPRRLAASSGFFPSGRATANRLTVPINSCTSRSFWCS